MFPREAEVLLYRIVEEAEFLQSELESLRDNPHQVEEAVARIGVVIAGIRMIRFDAQRVSTLAQADTDALREIYEKSVHVVDAVRAAGAAGDPLDLIADIQEAIVDRFPNDVLEA